MILYYAPTACSMAPHIALEETGLPFEARRIDLAQGDQTSPAFLAINPQGRVPALIINGAVVTEVPALLTYIASLRPDAGLVPPAGTLALARCFQWLAWLSSTLHVAYAQFRRPGRFVGDDFPCLDAFAEEGRLSTIRHFREVEAKLGDGWATGEEYSIADMYLFPFYGWAWRLELDMPVECPKWTTLVERLKERPAVQRAMAREAAPA
jgi:glutathione S-transferase